MSAAYQAREPSRADTVYEQLKRDIEIKNEEIKILLERIDQYKKHKDDQIE